MKIVLWAGLVILGLFAALGVLQFAASERVEVVVLHSTDDAGETVETRLWIVDHEGLEYLRTDPQSGWYDRLNNHPDVQLERNGVLHNYTAALTKSRTPVVNQLMNDKYTWGDDVISMMFDRSTSIAVELQPRG